MIIQIIIIATTLIFIYLLNYKPSKSTNKRLSYPELNNKRLSYSELNNKRLSYSELNNNINHHVVIARYNENLDWLFYIMEKDKSIHAFIYNDGPEIELPPKLKNRITIKIGDKEPSEPTKYAQYIIDYYNDYANSNIRVTFLQGNPIEHSPYLYELFDSVNKWDRNYQNLTLYAYPPPWLCAYNIVNDIAPNITYIDRGKIWNDKMSGTFHGILYPDPYIEYSFPEHITIPFMCNYLNIDYDETILYNKSYCACFSTTWNRIKTLDTNLWLKIIHFVKYGNNLVYSKVYYDEKPSKFRAIIMEYMWAVIFDVQENYIKYN